MKILITDDERLVRINLMSMLEELYPGENQIYEAKDGQELLTMVERQSYDVALLISICQRSMDWMPWNYAGKNLRIPGGASLPDIRNLNMPEDLFVWG